MGLSGTGIAPPPILTIVPVRPNFGNQQVDTTSSAQVITVTNTGEGMPEVGTLSLLGDGAGQFTLG